MKAQGMYKYLLKYNSQFKFNFQFQINKYNLNSLILLEGDLQEFMLTLVMQSNLTSP